MGRSLKVEVVELDPFVSRELVKEVLPVFELLSVFLEAKDEIEMR